MSQARSGALIVLLVQVSSVIISIHCSMFQFFSSRIRPWLIGTDLCYPWAVGITSLPVHSKKVNKLLFACQLSVRRKRGKKEKERKKEEKQDLRKYLLIVMAEKRRSVPLMCISATIAMWMEVVPQFLHLSLNGSLKRDGYLSIWYNRRE